MADAPQTLFPVPDEWRPGIEALRALPDGGAALLLGATDRGKTTFVTLAAQILAGETGRVAIVDADIGQSEIGPPGTVGLAWADAVVPRLHDLKPLARFFVGAWSPVGVVLEHVAATGRAVARARSLGARRLLIDTTGLVEGPAARRLKTAKAQIVAPDLVLAVARGNELDSLLALLSAATGAQALALPSPDVIGRKSTTVRATRRMTRLADALQNSREIALPLSDLLTVGATLGTGEPLPPHLIRWTATALRLPVRHAERSGGTLSLFVDGPPPRAGWESISAPVAEHFGARTVRALSLRAYTHLYVGLHGANGELLSVGRVLRLDPERGELRVAAPPPAAPDRVQLLAFGRVRVLADGGAGREVRPGEI